MAFNARFSRPNILKWLPAWRVFTANDWTSSPTPPEHTVVRAPGPDPLQILLLGGGSAIGYGVSSQDVALSGHLARQVAQRTNRGVDMTVAVTRRATITRARQLAQHIDPQWYDAVVLFVGVQDVLEGANPHWWSGELDALISHFRPGLPGDPEVFVLETPSLVEALGVSRAARAPINRLTERLGEELERLAHRRGDITVLPFQPTKSTWAGRAPNCETYRYQASLIAPAISRILADRVQLHPKVIQEDTRQRAVQGLRIIDTPPDERFEQIVVRARDRFRSDVAAISFMDTDRQWFKAVIGAELAQMPRGTTFCEWTIQGNAAFVVPDATLDGPFASLPIVTQGNIRAYAGHPILDPCGVPVGVICVLYTNPHQFTPEDLLFLRQLAALVETLLVPA